jgi:hypothetical protein
MQVILDPTTEDAANVQLAITDTSANYLLTGLEIPDPELKSVMASSFYTEGEIPADEHAYQNRTVTVRLDVRNTTATLLESSYRALTQKLAKFNREPETSTVKVIFESGNAYVFDVVSATSSGPEVDLKWSLGNTGVTTLTFVCRPFARGATPQVFGPTTESTLPVLTFTAASVKGDVPGLGKLLIDEIQAIPQWTVWWGLRSRYYSASADQALFYQAEGRTLLNGATSTAVTGASAGNAVQRPTSGYLAFLSTQATGGGNHLQHTGEYRVFARVMVQIEGYKVGLEWSVGDNSVVTRNEAWVAPAGEGDTEDWRIVDLGMVNIPRVVQGTQRWQGRIVADSLIANSTYIDCFWLMPTTEGYGVATGTWSYAYGSTLTGREEFSAGSGGLNAIVAAQGGTWATSGSTTDFTHTGSDTVTRTTVSDSGIGRHAVLGTTNHTASFAEVEYSLSSVSGYVGLLMRWTDANNQFRIRVVHNTGATFLVLEKYITSSQTVIGTHTIMNASIGTGTSYTLRAALAADGTGAVWHFPTGGAPVLVATFQDSSLATGATLASGENGFFDMNTSGTANTRTFYRFIQGDIVASPALHASQSLEVRHDRAIREDSAGAIWQPVPSYEGAYIRVPPAGQEGRTSQVIVKVSRGLPGNRDPAIDDHRGTLTVTPRYMSVPEA